MLCGPNAAAVRRWRCCSRVSPAASWRHSPDAADSWSRNHALVFFFNKGLNFQLPHRKKLMMRETPKYGLTLSPYALRFKP